MKTITFLDNINEYKLIKGYVVVLSSFVKSKEELLTDLCEKLHFPDYFGNNWDSVSECLRDLHWVKEKRINIIYEDIPQLKEDDLKIYLDLLVSVINDWKEDEEHYIEVVFPERVEKQIMAILKS
jgi:RNAse (barnase) inhibitor barstar